MLTFSLIRKIASVLLLLCFFLPLSTCSFKSEPKQGTDAVGASVADANKTAKPAENQDNVLYATEMLHSGWEELKEGNFSNAIVNFLAIVTVFFLPCAVLAVKEKPKAIISFVASFPAGYILFFWVFLGRTPQIGGVLAVICWASLLVISVLTMLNWWRLRKKMRILPNQ
ncbi:hypothetical protein [Undibacterium sp. TJN19]|uniref:hypothetical protein n=1 Tax=Undibacterium sp. TJN19 TaxID=3413055 RepID=UPI003BF1436A